MKILGKRALIEAIEAERTTKSGIIIAETSEKERPVKGKIIEVGEDMPVSVGDLVIFKKYAPDEIEIDGKKYLIAEENDILCVYGQ